MADVMRDYPMMGDRENYRMQRPATPPPSPPLSLARPMPQGYRPQPLPPSPQEMLPRLPPPGYSPMPPPQFSPRMPPAAPQFPRQVNPYAEQAQQLRMLLELMSEPRRQPTPAPPVPFGNERGSLS